MVRDSLTERAARSHANAAGFSIPEKNIDSFLKNSNDSLNDEDFKNCYFVDYVLDSNFDDIHSLGTVIGNNMDCFGNGVDEVKVIIKNI